MPESYSKIFSIENGECRKIEFTKAKNIMDTLSKIKETHYIKKETVLSRFCNTAETKLFLKKMEGLNIYELPEEEILINKCIEQDSLYNHTRYIDAGSITLQIVLDKRVRSITYHHPDLQIIHCKNVEEWKSINKIIELFEEEWFSEKHNN